VPETAAAFLSAGLREPAEVGPALARLVDANKHLRKLDVVAGPDTSPRTTVSPLYRLGGGGLGLQAKAPVMRGATAVGSVAAMISADSVFDEAGFRRTARDERYELALRTASPAIGIVGADKAFTRDPIVLDYSAPGGERWQLAAVPVGGWIQAGRVAPWIYALAYLAALAIGWFAYWYRRSQQRAADRAKFIEDLYEAVPAALAMRDMHGRYTYVNRTWERMFEARRENVIGRHVRERLPEKEAEALLALDRAALEQGPGPFRETQQMIFRGRHLSQARSIAADANGEPIGILIANIDTTDHYILEQTLAAQARQLEKQNEALKESVRLREEVERIGRHDLKTPLNSILAVPRLLREGRELTSEELDLVNIVERAGYRILNLVNLSLDLFKMEQGTYRFEPRPVDLLDVVNKVMVDIVSHAESKNVLIRTLVNGRGSSVQGPVYAWGDELLCYSMLGNLVKNAIEASPEGGTVTVGVEGPRDVVMVRIHNAGAVPEAIREKFFEKYASAGKSEGTGLGTYSARLMARTQSGDISMRTSDEAGTTVAVWLPTAPESALAAAVPAESAERKHAARAALGTIRVLVVDDDEFNRLIVRRYLPPPVIVDTAVNGRAAIEAAAALPDVILMDLDMPIMDGYEAVERIRADEREHGRKRAAIIALSSHEDDQTVARCLATGFDYYLTKPVTRELLQQTIARFCSVRPATPVIDEDLRDKIPAFLASRREIAAEMQAALDSDDREGVRRAAHKLAGSFALYGFEWAADHCRALERDAARGERESLARRIESLQDHLQNVTVA
jgi:PAS domain S-box-containing protein